MSEVVECTAHSYHNDVVHCIAKSVKLVFLSAPEGVGEDGGRHSEQGTKN